MAVKGRSIAGSRERLERAWAWHTWEPRWLTGHVRGAVRRLALRAVGRSELLECKLDSGQRFLVDPTDVIQCHIGVRGEWEGAIYQAIRPLVREGDVVLDVGAHVGYSTILFADWVGDGGRVYSFEPFSPHVERIRSNLEINALDERVEIIGAAVSDVDGNADFYPPGDLNSGVGSLSRPQRGATPVVVPTMRLDDWIRARVITSIALCKLDVEGAEGAALVGMANALEAQVVKAFLVELHPAELETLGHSVDSVLAALTAADYEIRYWDRQASFTTQPDPDGFGYILAMSSPSREFNGILDTRRAVDIPPPA